MHINITKKQIKTILLTVLIILVLIPSIIVLKSMVERIIHLLMPKPDSDAKYWELIFSDFEPSKKGYSVLVNLDSLVLTLYEDGTAIKSWPVSGGSKDHPSPTGSWTVTDIENWGEGFGGSWIALNVPWGTYGIHGTVEPWVVGKNNISHGCIRMKNDDVAELKKYMSIGVPVYIKYENAPFRVLSDGKVGSDVYKLQVMLKKLGYYEETPDGRFGQDTFKALCQFQAEEDIKADGIAGQLSWNLLYQRVAELG